MKVDTISNDIVEFRTMIEPIRALLGGTSAMRSSRESYLPKFKAETADDYNRRLSVATLTPYFEDTVKSMGGRVFYKALVVDDLNEKVSAYKEDFNGSNKSMNGVFESIFFEALAYARSYIVIDYSSVEQAKSLQEEKDNGARPYAFKVGASQVMDVRKDQSGITLFKYMHSVIDEVNTNDFEIKYLDEIVLMTTGRTRFYRKSVDKEAWSLHNDVEIKVGGKDYPYVMASELKLAKKPPLANLADLNIKHWQSQSEQDNILGKARMPILKLKGTNIGKDEELLIQGAIQLPADGDAGYIEHTGAAIEAGQNSLNKLEEQMAVAGSKLLMRTKMALTDTQAKSESTKEVSELMLYGMMLNDFINDVIYKFGLWLGLEDAGSIDITDNLKYTVDSDVTTSDLLQSLTHGVISKRTVFDTLVARGGIADTRTYEEEQDLVGIERIGSVEVSE